MLVPFEGIIKRGRCKGVRVIEVDIDTRYYFAVSTPALPALRHLLGEELYELARTGAVWSPQARPLPAPFRRRPRESRESRESRGRRD